MALSRLSLGNCLRVVLLALALSACTDDGARTLEGRPGGTYQLSLTLEPGVPRPLEETILSTRVRYANDDQPVPNLQVVHERVVHNFIVKLDFSSFAHIHHEDFRELTAVDLAASTFSFPYRFPAPGHYRMVSEFTHADRTSTKHFDIAVGTPDGPPEVRIDLAREKMVGAYGARLLVSPHQPVAGFETSLVLELIRDGEPVDDLELILGSEIHVALWRVDGRHFGHAHSYTPHMAAMLNALHDRDISADERAERMVGMTSAMINMPAEQVFPGPRIPVRLVFPEPGVFAVFLQCAPGGVPEVFDFMLEVAAYRTGMNTAIEMPAIPTLPTDRHDSH